MKRLILSKSMAATLAAATIAAFAGAAAYAQSSPTPSERPRAEERSSERFERRAQRMEERATRRLERLKTDLKLTPQQETLWSPVEAQLRKMQDDRRAYRQANAGRMRNAELPDRIDMMSERMAANATQMRELSASIKPLWATLSADQKDTVRKALPGGRHMGPGGHRDGHRDGHGEGRGDRRG